MSTPDPTTYTAWAGSTPLSTLATKARNSAATSVAGRGRLITRTTAPSAVRTTAKGNAGAVRVRVSGRSPEGGPITEVAVVFTRGTRVYQAAVLGAQPDADAVAVFFDSLRLDA